MSPSFKYAATGSAAVALIAGGLWPVLDPAGRVGILTAAAIAVPVQVASFAVLVRFRSELNAFLAAWIGGTLLRIGVVGGAAFWVIRSGMEGAVPMLLALASFFFGLLLLEPVFFRVGPSALANADTVEA